MTTISIPARDKLEDSLPFGSTYLVSSLLKEFNVRIRLVRNRNSKLGDYKPPQNGYTHRVSINMNLNRYAFLLTLIHELAHLSTWKTHKNRVKPHGAEWKVEFIRLMHPFLSEEVFPAELLPVVKKYMRNPKASSFSDTMLVLAIRKYDVAKPFCTLQELALNKLFATGNGRRFMKGEKLRKRYQCKELKTGKYYLFNPVAEVIPFG